jgi:hypothetical protein
MRAVQAATQASSVGVVQAREHCVVCAHVTCDGGGAAGL